MSKKQVPLSAGKIRDAASAGMDAANGRVLYFEETLEMVPPEGCTFLGTYELVEVDRRTYTDTGETRWFAKPNRLSSLEIEVSYEELPPKVVELLERKSREALDESTSDGKLLSMFLKRD